MFVECRYEINGSSGVVTSPSYGGSYPANSQCVYEFSFPANQRLSVRFLTFDLEKELKDGSCPDFLRVCYKRFFFILERLITLNSNFYNAKQLRNIDLIKYCEFVRIAYRPVKSNKF